jgi:hypothetical protein
MNPFLKEPDRYFVAHLIVKVDWSSSTLLAKARLRTE